MTFSAEQISEITCYLDAATPLPVQADLLFVFGTLYPAPAHLAAGLYAQVIAPYIVVTGGPNRTLAHHNEAEVHYEILLQAGVSPERVIKEDRSTNTLENVQFALPLIAQRIPLTALKSVIAISKWMHSRRALMTLKRQMPPGVRLYAQTYECGGISRENWYLDPRKPGANVLKEWERIPQFLERGHLEEIIPHEDGYI